MMGLQNKTRHESSYFIFIIILKKLISFFLKINLHILNIICVSLVMFKICFVSLLDFIFNFGTLVGLFFFCIFFFVYILFCFLGVVGVVNISMSIIRSNIDT